MFQLATIGYGDAAAVYADFIGYSSVASGDDGIGYNHHVAAWSGYCTRAPIGAIVPVAVDDEAALRLDGIAIQSTQGNWIYLCISTHTCCHRGNKA